MTFPAPQRPTYSGRSLSLSVASSLTSLWLMLKVFLKGKDASDLMKLMALALPRWHDLSDKDFRWICKSLHVLVNIGPLDVTTGIVQSHHGACSWAKLIPLRKPVLYIMIWLLGHR